MKIDNDTYKAYKEITKNYYKYLCHAPFNTLSFKENGDVTACCYNSDNFCENLNNKNIFEIINSKDRKLFQKNIKNHILPSGCSVCSNHFQNYDFKNIATLWYPQKINRNGFPSNLEFKISNHCNLNCIMCLGVLSEQRNSTHTPYNATFFKDLEKIIPYLENTTFNGGEPMLINEYLDLWQKIKERNKNCRITIHTNCTIIPPAFEKLFIKGGFSIIASIDSFEKAKYEEIRVNASFEKTWHNFKFYLEHSENYGNEVKLNFCPMKNNWKEIPHIIEYCNSQNIVFNFSFVFFPFSLSLYNTEYVELLEIIEFFNSELKKMTESSNTEKFKNFTKELTLFNRHIQKEKKYIQPKQEIFNFIFSAFNLSQSRRLKLNEIGQSLPEGSYFNIFEWIGVSFIKKTGDILNSLKTDELEKNLLSLKKE